MSAVILRTLRHEFRIRVPDLVVRNAFRFVETAPKLPDFDLEPMEIEVVAKDGFYAARMPDGSLLEGSPDHLIHGLHRLMFNDVIEGESTAVVVHGASVQIEGRHLFLVGHKGCGKTTITLHLLAGGHQVEGDEHLLVRSGDVVARPRTLRIKPGTLALVPKIADAVARAPFVRTWDGTPIRAFSPALKEGTWTIRPHGLDAIIFLTANHGGRSLLSPLPIDSAFRRMIAEVVYWPSDILAATARLRALLSTTRTGELLLGDLAGAEWHLRRFVTS